MSRGLTSSIDKKDASGVLSSSMDYFIFIGSIIIFNLGLDKKKSYAFSMEL